MRPSATVQGLDFGVVLRLGLATSRPRASSSTTKRRKNYGRHVKGSRSRRHNTNATQSVIGSALQRRSIFRMASRLSLPDGHEADEDYVVIREALKQDPQGCHWSPNHGRPRPRAGCRTPNQCSSTQLGPALSRAFSFGEIVCRNGEMNIAGVTIALG